MDTSKPNHATKIVKLAIAPGSGKWSAHSRRLHAAAFFEYGLAFLHAAAKTGSPLVRAYLLGHALEILLKTYLIRKGVSTRTLRGRAFGHHLDALLARAEQEDIHSLLRVSDELRADLAAFSQVYASKGLEYFNILYLISPPRLPRLDRITRFTRSLSRALQKDQ